MRRAGGIRVRGGKRGTTYASASAVASASSVVVARAGGGGRAGRRGRACGGKGGRGTVVHLDTQLKEADAVPQRHVERPVLAVLEPLLAAQRELASRVLYHGRHLHGVAARGVWGVQLGCMGLQRVASGRALRPAVWVRVRVRVRVRVGGWGLGVGLGLGLGSGLGLVGQPGHLGPRRLGRSEQLRLERLGRRDLGGVCLLLLLRLRRDAHLWRTRLSAWCTAPCHTRLLHLLSTADTHPAATATPRRP